MRVRRGGKQDEAEWGEGQARRTEEGEDVPVLGCKIQVIQPEGAHGEAKDRAEEGAQRPRDRRHLEALLARGVSSVAVKEVSGRTSSISLTKLTSSRKRTTARKAPRTPVYSRARRKNLQGGRVSSVQ